MLIQVTQGRKNYGSFSSTAHRVRDPRLGRQKERKIKSLWCMHVLPSGSCDTFPPFFFPSIGFSLPTMIIFLPLSASSFVPSTLIRVHAHLLPGFPAGFIIIFFFFMTERMTRAWIMNLLDFYFRDGRLLICRRGDWRSIRRNGKPNPRWIFDSATEAITNRAVETV